MRLHFSTTANQNRSLAVDLSNTNLYLRRKIAALEKENLKLKKVINDNYRSS